MNYLPKFNTYFIEHPNTKVFTSDFESGIVLQIVIPNVILPLKMESRFGWVGNSKKSKPSKW